VALTGCVFGLLFSSYSTLDYAQHLDRGLHDLHCSFIPGATATSQAESCRAAMYSPFGALARETLWGGIPVSLFALGAFVFLGAFAIYLLMARWRAPARAVQFMGVVGVTPLLVSIAMFFIALIQVGALCKTCVGIYMSSTLVAIGSVMGVLTLRSAKAATAPEPRPAISPLLPLAWLAAMGLFTLLPAVVYAAAAPDQRPYLTKCGQLDKADDSKVDLLHFTSAHPVQPALIFEDPLCATCKAFHERLVHEGILARLDTKVALFPLDDSCNWMIDRALHPGACLVAKAVLCGKERSQEVLEWAYDKQEELLAAGKQGEAPLRSIIQGRWGQNMLTCIDARETNNQLNKHLHFAADNGVPVSTPQLYLGKQRICDEDTDIGLRYTLRQLAPEVLP